MSHDEIVKDVVDAVLSSVGGATVEFGIPPETAGVAQVLIKPFDREAPEVCLTDTTVSLYLEFLGAHWEDDSSEYVSFEARVDWAIDCIRCAAEFGLVRVRRRGQFWGRQTHLLTSHDDLDRWRADRRFVIVRAWPSWC